MAVLANEKRTKVGLGQLKARLDKVNKVGLGQESLGFVGNF